MAEARDVIHGYACQEVVELVSEYLDGAMTSEQLTRFELHVNLCDGCSTFLDQIRTTTTMAGDLTEEHIPDEIKSKLLAAFRDWNRE